MFRRAASFIAILAILAGVQMRPIQLVIPMAMAEPGMTMAGMASDTGSGVCKDCAPAITAADACGAVCAISIAVIDSLQPFRGSFALTVRPWSNTLARSHSFPPDIAPPRS
jgi:hypothetical protein